VTDGLVFGRSPTVPFAKSTVARRAAVAWKLANEQRAEQELPPLVPIGLHSARHTCASTFIAAGANPKQIQVLMGHANIAMTFDRYGHLMPGGLEEAAAAADAYLARQSWGAVPI
jgi:integrase